MQPITREAVLVDRRQPVLRWSAVFAATISSIGFWILLQLIGVGIGLAAVDLDDIASPHGVGAGAIAWSLISPLIAMFLGGFVAGKKGITTGSGAIHSLNMHGTAVAQNASARIDIDEVDSSGNWPMKVIVRGLPQLKKGSYYEMFLTRHGKPFTACGIFTVAKSPSTIHLSMPPTVTGYDGWIVTRESPGREHQIVLTT
jgi:hypothetical protein